MADPTEADLDAELMRPARSKAAPGPRAPVETLSHTDMDRELMGGTGADTGSAKPGDIDPITGQPFQFATMPDNSPVARSLGKPIYPNPPGPVTQAIVNLSTDPEQRRRIAAARLFPEMSPLEAQSRVFYGPNGQLAAVGRNGNPIAVDPIPPDIAAHTAGNPLEWVASGAGAAIPMAGGLAGSLVAGPGSPLLGTGLAAGGAAAGDIGRQFLARYFDPSTQPTPIDLSQTAREAALSGGGHLLGSTVSNALAPNALRVSPGEVKMFRAGPLMSDARNAYDRAAAQGVQLTPGQASGLPSLLQYEDASMTMPQTVDQASRFYRGQGEQIKTAGERMLDTLSPNADKTDAALMFSQGAEDATRAVRQQANAAARPSYETAQAAGNVMSPDLAQLADVPVVKTALNRASQTYQNLYRTKPPDTPDFAMWDLAKRQLDDAYTVAQRAGERTDAMAIDKARQDLVTHLDTAFPTYGQARAIAAPGQRLASQLEEAGIGKSANAGIDERARAIVAPAFNQNPRAVAQARDAFEQAGRTDEWNAGVRSYVQDAFDQASMSQQGLNPSMLRRSIWGNVNVRDNLQAAMTPDQFKGFSNFLQTVEDTAKTYPMNSLTATRLNAKGALGSAAENQANVRAIGAAQTLLSPPRLIDLPGRMLEGVRQGMAQRNLRGIVGHLFSPDGMAYLEAMSRVSPGSQRAIETTAQLLTRNPHLLAAPEATSNNPAAGPRANPLSSTGATQP